MKCDRYDEYIDDSSSNHLMQLVDTAVIDISEELKNKVTFGVNANLVFNNKMRHYHQTGPLSLISETGQKKPAFLEGKTRVYEFNQPTWRYPPNKRFFHGRMAKGIYSYHTGTIFLCSGLWCRKTLTHEVLHAVSLISNIDPRSYPQLRSHTFMIEGITETLTGYLLMKRYPECFKGWIEKKHTVCALGGYEKRVRLWASLANQIGIKPLADFFLSSDKSIETPWKGLISDIHKKGYKQFAYPLDEKLKYDENRFKNMVFSTIPEAEPLYTDLNLEAVFRQIKYE